MDETRKDGVEYLSPSEATAHFAAGRSAKSILRFMKKGVAIRIDGGSHRLRLRCLKEGQRYFTTAEWIEEFRRTEKYWLDVANGFAPEEAQ